MLKTFLWSLVISVGAILIGTVVALGIASDNGPVNISQVMNLKFALVAVAIMLVFSTVSTLAAYAESRDWNGGICRQTGQRWQCFDMDSQGGRGYKSGDCTIWISYPVDTISRM